MIDGFLFNRAFSINQSKLGARASRLRSRQQSASPTDRGAAVYPTVAQFGPGPFSGILISLLQHPH